MGEKVARGGRPLPIVSRAPPHPPHLFPLERERGLCGEESERTGMKSKLTALITHLTSYALFRDLMTARCPGVVLTVFTVGVRDKR